jgi:hypothetical protein
VRAVPDGPIARNAVFRIELDDYPDPEPVGFPAIVLRSGTINFDMDLSVDLAGRAIVVKPRALLTADTTYELIISSTIRSLDDRNVNGPLAFQLNVSDRVAPTMPPAAPVLWSDVQPFIGGCAPFCHSPVGRSGMMRTPTRLLDLTGDPTNPMLGLISVRSVGLEGTPAPLDRVAPGDPARSVLLRKLLGGVRISTDPLYPQMRVDGRRMPIEIDPGTPVPPPLPDEQILRVQQWIQDGALVQ